MFHIIIRSQTKTQKKARDEEDYKLIQAAHALHSPEYAKWEMDVSLGKPTCDTFKASRTSRTFNVFPIDHKSPSPVPMWDEVSRDSPFGKPTVTRREVITPTGRSRTRHSKTQMPNVMDVHTPIWPCTNVAKSTVTTTELSPIRGNPEQDDSENEALVSPVGSCDYELSPCSILESDINDTVIGNSHNNVTANSSICNYEKKKKKVGIRKTGHEICGPDAILRALSEGCCQCKEADRCAWNSLNPGTASTMMDQCRKYRVDKIPVKSTCEFLTSQLTRGKVNMNNQVRYEMTCNSVPLCQLQWLHLYGFSAGSTTVKRALRKIKEGSHSFAKQRSYGLSQNDVATLWCVAEIKTRMGDLSPKTGKHMIVKPKTGTWWKAFLYDEKHTTKVSISQQRFSAALHAAYIHQDFLDKVTGKNILEVREAGSMTECDTCEDLQRQMGEAKTLSEFKHAKLQFDTHNASQKAERDAYYLHRNKAKTNPEEFMCIIIDGMDQFKLKTPQYKVNTKGNSTQLDTKISGVKVHGIGTYFYLTTGNTFKTGANLNIDCLHQTLIDLRKVYDEKIEQGSKIAWPKKLYLQVDGGSENKNRFLLAYLDRLVALNLFDEIKMNFLMVGHTHEDIDQVFSVIAGVLKEDDCLGLHEMIERLEKLNLNDPHPPKCRILHSVWDWKYFFVGGYLAADAKPCEEYITEAKAKYINMIEQFTIYHVFRFEKCKKDGYVFMRAKEWAGAKGGIFYPYYPEPRNPLMMVFPNEKHYPGLPQLTEKDHPTVPVRFNTDHNPRTSKAFFLAIRNHGRMNKGRWGDYTEDQMQGPFADWKKLEASMIFTEDDAIAFLGAFQWPHEIAVRVPARQELQMPIYQLTFKKPTHAIDGRHPLDMETNLSDYMPLRPRKHDKEKESMREAAEKEAGSAPEKIIMSHVAIAFKDKNMNSGYRVGELIQERIQKQNKNKAVSKTFQHTPAFNPVAGKVGYHWAVKVYELTTKDTDLEPYEMEWKRGDSRIALNWAFEDIILIFNATAVEQSSMQHKTKKQNKPSKSVRIREDCCEMIKSRLTALMFEGAELVQLETMHDKEKNYSGNEEYHAQYDGSAMSGDGLVGTRIACAYADENKVVTWYAGKVIAFATNDEEVSYHIRYDNGETVWYSLTKDDYGPEYYEGYAGWVSLKSIVFRVGDKVYVTEKVLQEKEHTVQVASVLRAENVYNRTSKRQRKELKKTVNAREDKDDTNVDGLLHAAATLKKQLPTTTQGASSMQYDARAALKTKVPNELDEDNDGESADDEDDKTLKSKADKAKNVKKKRVTHDLQLDPQVTYVEAIYYGVVEGVRLTTTSTQITVAWVTCVMGGKTTTKFKREVFGTKQKPEDLLMKSNTKQSRDNEEKHYCATFEEKYLPAFKEWMVIQKAEQTEEEATIAREAEAGFAIRAVGLNVVTTNDISRRMRLSETTTQVKKGSKGIIENVNEENLNEFNVRFQTIGRVVSLFRSEFEIIEDE